MTMKTNYIPKGYHSVVPYLIVKGGIKAIEFYKNAFGAQEVGRMTMPGGEVGHCELKIGDSHIMLSDEMPEWGNKSPQTLGGSAVGICLYVENVDEVFHRAIAAGGTVDGGMEVKDQFYGDRSGSLIDPFGHKWTIATHKEDVSFEEMQRRMDAMMEQQQR